MKNLKKNEKKGEQLNELALFAGAGGGILGGNLLGWRCVAAVEIEDYPRRVLLQRQADGILPRFPIWDDVQTFDGKPWRGKVDVISGGFPCQDISVAGKGAGIDGERSGMWSHMARIIGEVLPKFVFVENSPMLVGRGLARVIGDLAEMGYDAKWGIVGAHHVSAPHRRDRIWIVAHSSSENDRCCDSGETERQEQEFREGSSGGDVSASVRNGSQRCREEREVKGQVGLCGGEGGDEIEYLSNTRNDRDEQRVRKLREGEQTSPERADNGGGEEIDEIRQWWATEPELGRVAHGVADRVDRLKAIGNGQVPAVATTAFKMLAGENN